jgi:phospholipase A-2-activating protein
VRQWSLTSPQPPSYDDTISVQASDWFNSLAFAQPSEKHPNGLIAAGGKETIVYVKEPGTTSDSDPYRILPRHAHTISCLAFSEDGSKLISGGWDSQVFVWDVEAGDVIAELTGHTMTVWGILIYDHKFVFTACADKNIRMFDINGKLLRTIEGHTDVPRCFCKIPQSHWSGAAFASAGNDEIIRLWSLDGAPMGELHGHEAYIYSISILPNGDIVSSGEDRTVRVFRDGQCIQTITHPAISIWSVATCPETGDIVSGASDKTIRVFSRDPERHADAEVRLIHSNMKHPPLIYIHRPSSLSTRASGCMPFQPRRPARTCLSRRRTCPVLVSQSSLGEMIRFCRWFSHVAILLLQIIRTRADSYPLQRRYRRRLVSGMASNCSFVKTTTA